MSIRTKNTDLSLITNRSLFVPKNIHEHPKAHIIKNEVYPKGGLKLQDLPKTPFPRKTGSITLNRGDTVFNAQQGGKGC